ncbi:DUF3857 domain-containing protein [Ascidiimonas aurantiaca]|uniref:DUF3857 domain-containing protein n=1 Tax=Ascidiimonas aurantiaca TaxID=1685432 RepID=UPI0030EC3D0A
MKRFFLSILCTVPFLGISQYYKTYEWAEVPKISTVNDDLVSESSVGIFEKYIIEYTEDKTWQQFETHHTITRVNDEKGIQQHNKVYIPMYGTKSILDIRARTINANGAVKELDKSNIKEVQNVEEYGDFKIFAIEGIERGSDVEVLYTVEKMPYPFGSMTLQKEYPIQDIEFLFITGDMTKGVKSYFTDTKFEDTVINEKAAKRLVIEDVPSLTEEEYATPEANKVRVAYQCFSQGVLVDQDGLWGNIVGNIAKDLFPEKVMNEINEEVEDRIIQGKKLSDYQAVSLLEEYLKTNFTIIKNNNEQLSDVKYILSNRSASDYGILKIYAQFLTAMQIPYEVVISANRFEHRFDPDFFNPRALKEFLIYLPDMQQYVAPDRIDYRIGEAPFYILGNDAIYINKNNEFYFAEVTQADPDFSRIVRNIDVTFSEDMEEAVIAQQQEYYGHWAISNRAFVTLAPPESRKEFDDYLTSSGIENKTVKSYELINQGMFQEDYNTPFIVKSKITSSAMLEEAGDSYIFEVGKVIGTQSELYQEKERVHPIEMQYPNRYNYSIVIYIPEGYRAEGLSSLELNEKLEKDGKTLCHFTSNYEIKDNKIVVTIVETYTVNKFDKNDYESFRKVINAASDFNKATILFTPI